MVGAGDAAEDFEAPAFGRARRPRRGGLDLTDRVRPEHPERCERGDDDDNDCYKRGQRCHVS